MRIKSKPVIKFLFIILIILGGWYWYKLVKTKKPIGFIDYTSFSQKLDERINKELLSLGVSNENVLKKYHQKKSAENMCWLEITKEINIPSDCSLLVCKERISYAVEKIGGEIYSADFTESKGKLVITCGKDFKVLQNLILWQKRYLKKVKRPKYKIALVIDDLGYNKDVPDKFLKLNIPISFSILPREKYSTLLSKEIVKSGNQVLLHFPLEPKAYPKVDPGPWAVFVSMTTNKIRKVFFSNLESVPEACGVNNHMGSKFMEDEEKLRIFLGCVKEKDLFFLDSKTTNSCADKISKELGLKFARNEVFLDNKDDLDYVRKQLKLLYKKVLKKGSVIAIGHIQRQATPLALAEVIPTFRKKDIEFIFVSELVK